MNAANEQEIVESVRAALAKSVPIEILGHGTKRKFGRLCDGEELDVSAVRGIVVYEPEELIVTVRPGTEVDVLTEALSEKGQRLGFEPPDWGALLGASGSPTIGGVVSVDASGPARLRYGGPRDQLLGIRGVNGFGETFKAGGRVVKNVTGFDIPKLVCGAFGTLCILSELTFRVFPRPSFSSVLALRDISPEPAFALLRRVWSSPLEPTGLAYVPAGTAIEDRHDFGRGIALVRLEGARAPLDEKVAHLRSLHPDSKLEALEDGERVFSAIADGSPFVGSSLDVWRVHVPPAAAAALVAEVAPLRWLADLAGALLWLGMEQLKPDRLAAFQNSVRRAGGHALLLRADATTRAKGPVFPVETPERAALTRALRTAFDPLSLFNRGRMYEDI